MTDWKRFLHGIRDETDFLWAFWITHKCKCDYCKDHELRLPTKDFPNLHELLLTMRAFYDDEKVAELIELPGLLDVELENITKERENGCMELYERQRGVIAVVDHDDPDYNEQVILVVGDPRRKDYWKAIANAHLSTADSNDDYQVESWSMDVQKQMLEARIYGVVKIALITTEKPAPVFVQKYVKLGYEPAVWDWCADVYDFRENGLEILRDNLYAKNSVILDFFDRIIEQKKGKDSDSDVSK